MPTDMPAKKAVRPDRERYHHGATIRAFRLRRGLTQAQLAARWPGGAVNPQYVQRVETGKKRISGQETLRGLGELLDVPLWRFGLSEYDPFNPHNLPGHGTRMYEETLDAVECFVRQAWSLRCAALMPNAEECERRLNSFFGYFRRELPPPARHEARFLRLYAQVQRLNAVTAVERRDYAEARASFAAMRETAMRLGEASTLALAEMSIGAEHERAGRKQEAVDWLERARDTAFGASTAIAAFVHSYLARACAAADDAARFERAADTARTLADAVGTSFGCGADFVYARRSSVLAERSWGYLELGAPRRTLELRDEISRQITSDRDLRLHAWIPLDWARAYLRLGEIGASVDAARAFYSRVAAMGSPHAQRHATRFLGELAAAGYADAPDVRELRTLLAVPSTTAADD
jgi:transcriptional regulator with XRE-family HTH domain